MKNKRNDRTVAFFQKSAIARNDKVFVAVGDTNFYRSQTDAEIELFCKLERQIGVVAMGTCLAASELLAHVADRRSPSHLACRAAVRRLELHCFASEPPNSAARLIPHPHALLALRIFPGVQPGTKDLSQLFRKIMIEIVHGTAADEPPELGDILMLVKAHSDHLERRFVGMLETLRRDLGKDPTHPSEFAEIERPTPRQFVDDPRLRLVAARGFVQNVASDCGIVLTPEREEALGADLIPDIPTTLQVFVNTVSKVLIDGMLSHRAANSLWDMYFALLASPRFRLGTMPAILITDDTAILQAAHVTGATSRVMSTAQYRQFLVGRTRLGA